MKAWAIRGLFACLVLVALASKIQASHGSGRDIRAAVIELLAKRGLAAHAEPPAPGSALGGAVTFEVPGCEGRVQILPVGLNMQVSPLFDAAVGQGRAKRLVYLGRTWTQINRLELRLEWAKHKALSIWGLGRYAPDTTALLIAEPLACRFAESIDWGPVWYRPMPTD